MVPIRPCPFILGPPTLQDPTLRRRTQTLLVLDHLVQCLVTATSQEQNDNPFPFCARRSTVSAKESRIFFRTRGRICRPDRSAPTPDARHFAGRAPNFDVACTHARLGMATGRPY